SGYRDGRAARALLTHRHVGDQRIPLGSGPPSLHAARVLVNRWLQVRPPARHERAGAAAHPGEEPTGAPLVRAVAPRLCTGDAVEAVLELRDAACGRAQPIEETLLIQGGRRRLLPYDDWVGCPLDQALAALEWTAAVGILAEDDLLHAGRLAADAAAAVVERRDGDQHVFIYFGPRMDAPPADPYEGTLLYD